MITNSTVVFSNSYLNAGESDVRRLCPSCVYLIFFIFNASWRNENGCTALGEWGPSTSRPESGKMHAKWRQIENAGDRRRRYCAQILCSILRRIVSYSPGFIEAPLFASLAYYRKRAPLTEWAHDAQRARRGLHIIKYSLRNNCVRQAWGRACSTSYRCHYSCRSLRIHTIVLMFSQLAYRLAVISVPAAVFMTPCTKRIPSY